MDTVYKYEISGYEPEIEMPKGAEILTVAFQGDKFCLWAKVDTDAAIEKRYIEAFGTGHDIPRCVGIDWKYLGTGFMRNGLVFHAFERLCL